MNEQHWTDFLTDDDYREVSNNTQKIQCVDCEYQYCSNRCRNLYHHPVIPAGFACKNGKLKRIRTAIKKMSILEKFLCNTIGHHEASEVRYNIEGTKYTLIKCECCGRYGVSVIGIPNIKWYSSVRDENMPIEIKQYITKFEV